jgi:hypothetical protein
LRRRDGDGRLWGFQRGWAEVGPRRAWAATHFHGGHYSQEDISVTVGEDVACLVCLERSARNASDGQPLPIMELRVTQTFRLEATGGASSTATPTSRYKNANPLKPIQAVGATHQTERGDASIGDLQSKAAERGFWEEGTGVPPLLFAIPNLLKSRDTAPVWKPFDFRDYGAR